MIVQPHPSKGRTKRVAQLIHAIDIPKDRRLKWWEDVNGIVAQLV